MLQNIIDHHRLFISNACLHFEVWIWCIKICISLQCIQNLSSSRKYTRTKKLVRCDGNKYVLKIRLFSNTNWWWLKISYNSIISQKIYSTSEIRWTNLTFLKLVRLHPVLNEIIFIDSAIKNNNIVQSLYYKQKRWFLVATL